MVDISSYFLPSRNLSAELPQLFNVPNCTSLIIVKRRSGGQTSYLEIEPRPIIEPVNPRLVSAYADVDSVQFELEDLQVVINGEYSATDLFGSGMSYVIGGELFGGVVTGGFAADYIPGTQITRRSLDWQLLLRRRA